MSREQEVMDYLHLHVFDPVLDANGAPKELKAGVRLTILRMSQRDAAGMVDYFWSAVRGTERSTSFARQMKAAGFDRFEEVLEDFRERFGDEWLAGTQRRRRARSDRP